MSDDSHDFDIERLIELVAEIDEFVPKFKEAIVDSESDSDVVDLAGELWEVLDEVEDVLETIDLAEVSEAIDIEEIPEAVDIEDVPEGLLDEDENAIELTSVKEAVNLRELWDAVDLTELYQQKQELEDEVGDVTEEMGDDGDDDGLFDADLLGDEDNELFEDVVGMSEGAHMEFDAEARQAFIEEKIQAAVVKFREMLLETHDKLEKLYRMNQEKLGQPGRQPNSLNPTAMSTMPSGPVPESASLRTSTVPSQVRYSRVENPRRIYAHRFRETTKDEEGSTEGEDGTGETSDDSETTESERDQSDEEDDEAEDGEIVLEVHDG